MAEDRAGVTIGKRAFLVSFFILLGLMIGAGIIGKALPSGLYLNTRGQAVDPGSYQVIPKPEYPVWRWLAAPIEVLASPDALQVGVILAFIAVVGGAFAVLQKAGILEAAVSALAARAGRRKRLLLALVSLFFMLLGSLMGIFEEVIPLVPVAIALAVSLGWDLWVGLGMSILATGFGFSAAIANPFSIGTAQRLAEVPVFSGALFRVGVFALVYVLYLAWLLRLARKAEAATGGQSAKSASGSRDGIAASEAPGKPIRSPASAVDGQPASVGPGVRFFAFSASALLLSVIAISVEGSLSEYSMPITALLFLTVGLGSGAAAKLPGRIMLRAFFQGVMGILPGVILVLQAVAVKRIIIESMVMDTILHGARDLLEGSSSYGAAALIYLFTLGMNFFIGSATAKAFLLMPILAPLADIAWLPRQIAVQAFAFGDGFSNMLYPTNAVLLISLGLAGVSWPAWFKRTALLQLGTLALTMALLMLAVAIGYS